LHEARIASPKTDAQQSTGETMRIRRSTALIIIVAVNLVASILYFGDNMITSTITRASVDSIASCRRCALAHHYANPVLAWWFSSRNAKWTAVSLFWLYGGLSLLVLGHYRFAAPSE
jgi:hypothetical protein